LLASLASAIGTTVIIKLGKAKYAWITFMPFAFVSVTTLYASYLNIVDNFLPKGKILLVVLTIMIMLTAIGIIVNSLLKWYNWLVKKESYQPFADDVKVEKI
jgi:carbon starvation protein